MKRMILALVATLGLNVFAQAATIKVCDTAMFGTATVTSSAQGEYEIEFNGRPNTAAYFEFTVQEDLASIVDVDAANLNLGEGIIYTSMTLNGLTAAGLPMVGSDHPVVLGAVVNFDLTQVRKVKMYDIIERDGEPSGVLAVLDVYDGNDNYLGSLMGGGFFVGQCQ